MTITISYKKPRTWEPQINVQQVPPDDIHLNVFLEFFIQANIIHSEVYRIHMYYLMNSDKCMQLCNQYQKPDRGHFHHPQKSSFFAPFQSFLIP